MACTRSKLLLCLAAGVADTAVAQNPADFAREVMSSARTQQKAGEVIGNIGLNCIDPANWEIFFRELERVLEGVGRIMAEDALQRRLKPDYPTLCHVMTTEQIGSYRESNDRSRGSRCLVRDPIGGGCALSEDITTDSPHPEYYWPKYFIEVNEKGNDSHAAFAKRNGIYTLNRQISRNLQSSIDMQGAAKLTALVLGGSHALGAVGMRPGPVSPAELAKTAALTPFENMRVRAGHAATQATHEVAIWPVALSAAVAEHFTVCGPKRVEEGKSPGGYMWKAKGVPMTCPVAISRDAMHFWDTGMLDYLDPAAVAQMGIASNPLSCGAAAAMDAFGGMGEASREGLGDKTAATNSTSGMSNELRSGVLGCSYPILGSSEALMSKALSMTDAAKWQGPYCTVWGSLAPRISTSVYETDYSYANAGLKFKLMAHELFGLPRGDSERWSLAYPWEGPSSGATDAARQGAYSSITGAIGGVLDSFGVGASPGTASSRSEGLFRPGDPVMTDAGFTMKFSADQATNLSAELLYITSLGLASAAARESAVREFRRRNGTGHPGEAAVSVAAAAAPWVAAEQKRARDGELRGVNVVPGGRRIYTVWEKIECGSDSKRLTVSAGGVTTRKYESCDKAIQFEVYKYVQLELMRKACDWMGQRVGKPWK